ncbi:hypothetical protein LOTGIDRAFT_167168 [Lottia gigantea]|uniref:2',3'-cyclic-nucleotide 3'-phosphodiesterase n=1 Tax=Lottia gigantea TaxID=225164 RepID=V3ZZE5_LOTGI|nr:hypothetical protein LOTGIDRAFT_167168 [Lottia gigantea]ESO86356.1 hypothetical protein LOTGIDRAFT_167168 [Lottia gigantea]
MEYETVQYYHSQPINHEWLNYPFITDKDTVQLIEQSKVMFLMRGLSGSGKSTVVKKIQTIYPSNIVCSADNCFLDERGNYNYDFNKLSNAHDSCKEMAKINCQRGVQTVIIDNTNVKYWEAKYYFNLAYLYNYIVIIVTPKTPWQFNAEELCRRNKHGVDLITIHRKLNTFEDFIPFFYGWFLNETLSKVLVDMGMEYLRDCLELYPTFKSNLLSRLAHVMSDGNILKDYFTRDQNRHILHCTAKYVGKGRHYGGKQYHSRKDVKNAYAYAFTLTLFGFTFTGNTLGARIHLPKEALDIFDKPEELQRDSKPAESPLRVSPTKSPKMKSRNSTGKSSEGNFDDWANSRMSTLSGSYSVPVSSEKSSSPTKNIPAITKLYPFVRPNAHGRSAHMTLGTAYNIPSKETNIDLLDICDMEAKASADPTDFQAVKGGRARCYDENHCCIYLDKPYNLSVLFTGSY